jgi:hypothetical protein
MVASGTHRTFAGRPWNGGVGVGATASFRFVGAGATPPVNCRLSGAPCGGGGDVRTVAPTTAAPTEAAPAATPTAPPAAPDPAPPPASGLFPLTVTNDTGRNDVVNLYVLGVKLGSGKPRSKTPGCD